MKCKTENTKAFYNNEIPSDWEFKALFEISKNRNSSLSINSLEDNFGDYLLYGANGIIKSINFFEESEEYISIVKDGAGVGRVFLCENNSSVLGTMAYIKPLNKNYDLKYLYFLFQSIDYSKYITGSTIPHIYFSSYSTKKILIPPLHEQKAIAQVLSTADAAIHTTEKLITQKELRKKWLIQQLLTGKKRLRDFSGEWQEIHIRDVAKEVSIRNKSDKQLTVLSCTKYDGLVPSLEYFGRKIFADDVSTYKIVPKNHFAYATNHIEEGSIGYQEILDEALISPMYTVFKTDKNVNDNFFYKLLKSHPLVYQYQNRMEGSIDRRGGLRWDGFSIIKIKLPSYEEQTAIAQVLQAADKEISLLKAKAEKLREQKKGLMQQLLTGKVRLKINNE